MVGRIRAKARANYLRAVKGWVIALGFVQNIHIQCFSCLALSQTWLENAHWRSSPHPWGCWYRWTWRCQTNAPPFLVDLNGKARSSNASNAFPANCCLLAFRVHFHWSKPLPTAKSAKSICLSLANTVANLDLDACTGFALPLRVPQKPKFSWCT